jgi:Cu(I)/Ag(I) efflux system membrane fusion protein
MKKMLFLLAVILLMTANGLKAEDTHAMLKVSGLCEMCQKRIEKAALSVEGTTVAGWNDEIGEVHLHFDSDKTNVKAISKAIAKAGHDTEFDKADDKTYNALPGCCKYRTKK